MLNSSNPSNPTLPYHRQATYSQHARSIVSGIELGVHSRLRLPYPPVIGPYSTSENLCPLLLSMLYCCRSLRLSVSLIAILISYCSCLSYALYFCHRINDCCAVYFQCLPLCCTAINRYMLCCSCSSILLHVILLIAMPFSTAVQYRRLCSVASIQ
jgi:hypothetical protein